MHDDHEECEVFDPETDWKVRIMSPSEYFD